MQDPGPFDRILQISPEADRAGRWVVGLTVGLGLLLLILVLPPVCILSRGGDEEGGAEGGAVVSTAQGDMPRLPEAFEALSSLYEISTPGAMQGALIITVNLLEPLLEERNVALYTFADGRWQRLSGATLVNDGTAAQGEVGKLPGNVAVLRRSEGAMEVTGWLPSGASLDLRTGSALTVLNPVDFAPAGDGSLVGNSTSISPEVPFRVCPTVRTASPEDVETVNGLLASPDLRRAHVDAILAMVREAGYDGVDLDYGGVSAARADEFAEMVETLAAGLHADGRRITLLLPLPSRAGSEWDTGGYDWERLGETADHIKVAPEEDQGAYYRRMEDALDFLTGLVEPRKLLLVVGGLSREKGSEGIRTLTFSEALTLASVPTVDAEGDIGPGQTVRVIGANLAEEEGASGLYWDDEALAVTFTYPGRGGKRTVWLSNVFSTAFRLDLARRRGLGGVAMEDVSSAAGEANIWPAIQEYAETGSVTLVRPNGELLAPQWSASGGSLDTEVGSTVQWQTPDEPGLYEVTLIVSDGVVRVGQRLVVEVRASPVPAAS
jgi:hypothetical protein